MDSAGIVSESEFSQFRANSDFGTSFRATFESNENGLESGTESKSGLEPYTAIVSLDKEVDTRVGIFKAI